MDFEVGLFFSYKLLLLLFFNIAARSGYVYSFVGPAGLIPTFLQFDRKKNFCVVRFENCIIFQNRILKNTVNFLEFIR